MIGTTIGKYRIVGFLGRGATGIVYRAVDGTLEREVAIKVLNPHVAAADIMKRFRAEAAILAKLSHPQIATIHELLQTDTDQLMVMELVRGETLEKLSTRVGPMAPDIAARLIDAILSALDHAHHNGIVHRDLKPANVMVTQLGGIKIMDFGIARVRGAKHMTIDGCAVGTPAYMSPEQALGEEIDGRADLYAVGVVLYRLLTGKLPLDADTPLVMLQKQIAETPPPLHVHRDELPEWCEVVVQRALAKAPADRFQTAEEFRVAIGRATGLMPPLDLASALGIPADDGVSTRQEAEAVETLVLPSEHEQPPKTVAIHGAVDATQVAMRTGTAFTLAKNFVQTRPRTAWLGGVAVSIVFVAYLASNALADDPGRPQQSAAGTTARVSRAAPDPSLTPAPNRRNVPAAARPPVDTVSASASPVVFRTKIVRAPDGEARDQDAKLSLGEDRLTVATYSAPAHSIFSASYGDISAIEHSREPVWKPPQKLSKMIRVKDDVLDAIGIPERHHVALHTNTDDEFIVLRVDERIVGKLLKALKQRTGRDPEQ